MTRAGRPASALAFVAALAVFGYVGWDGALWDARFQLALHLIAIGAIGALVAIALGGGELPRTRIDLPLVGLLAAFALATASALNVGMSLRAMAVIVAYAAVLPVAILALRHRPSWVGWATSVPLLLLAVPTLGGMLGRRLDWIMVGAPGLPPLRLVGETTPFGSVAVPPFVLVPAWVLAGLIEPEPMRRVVRWAIVVVTIPLIILSGSRSVWLAVGAMAAVALVPFAWRRRGRLRFPRRVTPRVALGGAVGVGLAVLALILVLPRMTAVTSLVYRAALWADTLGAWSTDPVLGIGPGYMPFARQAAAADFTFPVRQPHSHNLLLGVLGDAGLVGLAAAIVLVVALLAVAGPWRCRTPGGRAASTVLIGLGVGGLFEDLTFIPGFSLLAIALLAIVLVDAGAVEWVRPALVSPLQRAAAGLGASAVAVVLLSAMLVADAGAIEYRSALDHAGEERWDEATAGLVRSTAIDPWHPAGPRALAVAADAAGSADLARRAAARATQLNSGDASSWANLALLCVRAGDRECATRAAGEAVASAPNLSADLVNAAVVLHTAGETTQADAAYRLSLLTQPLTRFMVQWPRDVSIGDGETVEAGLPAWQLNVLLARHATGELVEPATYPDPAVRALAHALRGERTDAERWIADAITHLPAEPRVWDTAVVLRDAWGAATDREQRIASVVRGTRFPAPSDPASVPRLTYDIASFRAFPRDGLVTDALRRSTEPPYPWILGELLP